jgi:hypothetical protein
VPVRVLCQSHIPEAQKKKKNEDKEEGADDEQKQDILN